MDLDELIERLEALREEFGGGTQVRIAYQPSYPLAAQVANVCALSNMQNEINEEIPGFVWIAATANVPQGEDPYAPSFAWDPQP